MDETPELLLKKLCCTCLSQNRKLSRLCRLPDGINNLYLLLSYDSDAYREGFYKDTANWYICWECWALMATISRFRSQACVALKRLSDIIDGKTDLKLSMCLSRLTCTHKTTFDKMLKEETYPVPDNFIDCGPEIKSESDEDVPLSELNCSNMADDNNYSDDNTKAQEMDKEKSLDIQPVYKKRKKANVKKKKKDKSAKKNNPKDDSSKVDFTTTKMSEEEMRECREKRKMAATYADAKYKCESCIEGFKSQIDVGKHVFEFHCQKDNHDQCDICLSFIPASLLSGHRLAHYEKYQCGLCDVTLFHYDQIQKHLTQHAETRLKKGVRKAIQTVKPGSKPRRSRAMMDQRTPYGYKCAECDKYFDNKNLRWKHVQRAHREGHACASCGKRFAFRGSLARHELRHLGPPPREECPQCHKQVRVDLLKVHQRIHAVRQRYACVECDKRFASRASYEHHLKYTAKHAPTTPNKYKCTTCDKAYRSRGELRDHTNYRHMGRTQHQCPVCAKALATPRGVTRHVRRAHAGRAERARDNVCQRCGNTFRDKKTLREHELIHTGERPLSCSVCGRTFRQSASLYTHRRRVHRLRPPARALALVQP